MNELINQTHDWGVDLFSSSDQSTSLEFNFALHWGLWKIIQFCGFQDEILIASSSNGF